MAKQKGEDAAGLDRPGEEDDRQALQALYFWRGDRTQDQFRKDLPMAAKALERLETKLGARK